MFRLSPSSKRRIAWLLIFSLIFQVCIPYQVFALTSGPSQPEFSSFEPVATTSMVNEFTGDFTYNLPIIEIPGPEGSGYALSLSYHSGTSPEEEASWVGYGWTLNPGAINRNKRGFPDDYNGDEVIYHNDVPASWTATLGGYAGNMEAFGLDAITASAKGSLRYNNYRGFGYGLGVSFSVAKGLASLGYSVQDGDGVFSSAINPGRYLVNRVRQNVNDQSNPSTNNPGKVGAFTSKYSNVIKRIGLELTGSNYGLFSKNWSVRNTIVSKYTGLSVNVTGGLQGDLAPLPAGVGVGYYASYSRQKAEPLTTKQVHGYLYAGTPGAGVLDYYLEKESPYTKKDKYLAIPFHNADEFSVTGEGLGGGFRAYQRSAGHFYPNEEKSTIEISNVGAEVHVGSDIGAGFDAGYGSHSLSVAPWKPNGTLYSFSPMLPDETAVFRFKNDLGGNFFFDPSDGVSRAEVAGKKPTIPANISPFSLHKPYNFTQKEGRPGRAAYIGFHTNHEMKQKAGDVYFKSYNKDIGSRGMVDRTAAIDHGIGEFLMHNEDGFQYVFGVPVYSRNEVNLQYGFKQLSQLKNNYIGYADPENTGNIRSKVGEERNSPYATTYLLSAILSPDYIDRNMNGPDEADFGAWTRFSYKRLHGSDDKESPSAWYRWRFPYTGYFYDRGELSDPKDDNCNFLSGEKEVYYLDTIETRTHFAVFYTSSRLDGRDAAADAIAGGNPSALGTKQLEQLDSIKLFAKDRLTGDCRLLQKTCFIYSYELMPNLPNSTAPGAGKLTLKKIYTEYEGVVNAKIAPYTFEYSYPAINYPAPYLSISNFTSGFSSSGQNPPYGEFNIDPWGYYQAQGQVRFENMQAWVDQTPLLAFDPAAWQLKVIKLPSGGEIHVQYEQKDYQFVQDRRAMSMVSLKPTSGFVIDDINLGNKFLLNTQDIGLTTGMELDTLAALIQKAFIEKNEKIYFKFLYRLSSPDKPDLNSCDAEYIDGYVKVNKVERMGTDIYVWLGTLMPCDGFAHPRQICVDFVRNSRMGMLNPNGDCSATGIGMNEESDPEVLVKNLLAFFPTAVSNASATCLSMEEGHSYLRIPLFRPKKGGGVRVKRLLMYDMDPNGNRVLFGNEYLYTVYDPEASKVTSSGVAINEPVRIRLENPLVTELEKRPSQNCFEKIIAGNLKDDFEGPIGETLLPAPHVGHSRVIVKNIHSGKTNPGYTVKEFFTAKDYPFDRFHPYLNRRGVEITEINEGDKEWLIVPAGLFHYARTNLWLTQGYSFIQTDFHGKPRSIETYIGDCGYTGDLSKGTLTSSERYTYFEVGEPIPVSHGLGNPVTMEQPGREMEVVMEGRAIEDITTDYNIEIDATAGLVGFIPIPFATAIPSGAYEESKLHTHVITRIASYPAIVKKVVRFQDGVYSLTENLAFSPENGRPLLTRTSDGYNALDLEKSTAHEGYYSSYQFAAADTYPALGQRAFNERKLLTAIGFEKQLIGPAYTLVATTSDAVNQLKFLTPGDLVELKDDMGIFHIGKKTGIFVELHPLSALPLNTTTGLLNAIEVINSGRANRLNENTGNLVVYGGGIDIVPFTINSLADRQAFITFINDLLANSTPSVFSFYPGTLGIKLYHGVTGDIMEPCLCSNIRVALLPHGIIGGVTYQKLSIQCYNTRYLCDILIPRSENPGLDHLQLSNDGSTMLYYQGDALVDIAGCQFCQDSSVIYKIPGVIDVNISTYSDNWPLPSADYAHYGVVNPADFSPYEIGAKGKWRPNASYVYRESIVPGVDKVNPATDEFRVYKDAGTFTMTMFNWNNLSANDPNMWLKVGQTNLYSPHGQALEEEDIRGVKSAAKYGYSFNLPYLVAQNGSHSSVYFESFENLYDDNPVLPGYRWEEGLALNSLEGEQSEPGHSGKRSFRLKPIKHAPTGQYYSSFTYKPIEITPALANSGLLVKIWLKARNPSMNSIEKAILNMQGLGGSPSIFNQVARVGEWALFEAKVDPAQLAPALGGMVTPRVLVELDWDFLSHYVVGNAVLPHPEIWLDDFRIQPTDSQMSCFVYDPATYRLLTSFDDQHFGLYYQYNAEGKLVRKMVETERGMKTVQETQYHTPLQPRN